ncbi:MAG TPA: amidohydrolase family protein [Terriglobales bacterium]|nr:amidohydrolase family protein [Terriglobales bacterium]
MVRKPHAAMSVAVWVGLTFGLMILALSVLGPLALAADRPTVLAITGGMLVDGNGGPPVHDSVVIVEGSKITASGSRGTVGIPNGAKVIDARGMTVMPGLFDAHVHLLIMGHGKYDEYFPKYRSRMRNEIMPASAKELLMHGVTSVRDMGANLEDILSVRDRVNRGELPGPRLFICGPFLQKTLPKVAFHYNMQIQADFRWTVDGPEDARAKVRKLVAAGVDFIKVIQATELTPAELQAIVDEAHKAGKTVATHGMDENELTTVLAAGVDSVEHTGLAPGSLPYSDDIVRTLVAKNTFVDPTGMVIWRYKQATDFPEGRYNAEVEKDYSPDLVQDMEQSYANFTALPYFSDAPGWIQSAPVRWRQLHNAGVRMLVGTDSGTPMNFHVDSTRREMQLLVANGMTPLEVITSATKYPAVMLKKDAELGTIEPGKLADIILVQGNVLEDISNLANVVHVIKGGEIYK